MDQEIGDAALGMRHDRSLHGILVDEINGLAGQIVQSVQVLRIFLDGDLAGRLLDIDNGLEHDPGTVLNELAQRMQVRRQIDRCREQALVILAFALAVELLPPLGDIMHAGLIVRQDLYGSAASVQEVSACCIQQRIIVLERRLIKFCHGIGCAGHQFVDIQSRGCDGKQADSGQHGETSADIIRHHEGLIAFGIRQRLEGALHLIGRRINTLLRFFLAVLRFQKLLEDTESDRRLGGRTGLGDDVDGEISSLDHVHQMGQIGAAHIAAAEIDLRRFADLGADNIVEAVLQEFDRGSCAEIGSADADDDQDIGLLSDLLRRFLDAGKLFLVIIDRKSSPANVIIAFSGAGQQRLFGCQNIVLQYGQIRHREEILCACRVKSYVFHSLLPVSICFFPVPVCRASL